MEDQTEYEMYLTELEQKGVPVDSLDEVLLRNWFSRHKDQVWKDEAVNDYIVEYVESGIINEEFPFIATVTTREVDKKEELRKEVNEAIILTQKLEDSLQRLEEELLK